MSELGPDARSILDAAREGDEPHARDHARVRAALARRIGVGAAVVTASVASATTAKGAIVSTSSLFAKLVILAGAVSLAASGAVLAVRYARHRREAETQQAMTARVVDPAPPAPIRPPPLPVVTEPMATASASVVPVVAPMPDPKASPSIVPSTKPDTLSDELSLLGAAMSALGAGDGTKALTILDEHAKKFPQGTLAEERNGARCIALCMLGHDDARTQAETFLAKHPDAPLRARIEKACALP